MTAAALRRLLVGAGHGTTGLVFLRRLMRSAALMMLLLFGAALAFLIKSSRAADGRYRRIVLKNSNFRVDHDSGDRWRPR
jgi:hypothetical protein